MRLATSTVLLCSFFALPAMAQPVVAPPIAPTPDSGSAAVPDERQLGQFIVTGTQVEHVTKLAILPSLNPDLEDVTVRSVVRHDLELSGMFDIIPDERAPDGMYHFDDPVDVEAWRTVGAEVIVKVAARRIKGDKLEVLGVAYFLDVGKDPVFERRFTCTPAEVRPMSHRVTDALLGAVTGKPGGFFSQFAFSSKWLRGRRVFRMDSDGDALRALTGVSTPQGEPIAINPVWGPGNRVFFVQSERYSPYRLMASDVKQPVRLAVPFTGSIYGVDFDREKNKIAVAVAESARSHIYVGSRGGSEWTKVSTTELATSPSFSPSGKLAWIGGGAMQGTQRVYVDGKAVSPAGFTAASPTFCDTEDGIRLVYSVSVGNDQQDLVMSDEAGRGIARLTQGQGSNFAPACSPDGRMLAFFSTRKGKSGLVIMNLKRFVTTLVSPQLGDSLSWAPLPESALPSQVTPK